MKLVGVLATLVAGYCQFAWADTDKTSTPNPNVLGVIDSEVTDGSSFITIRLGEGVEPEPIKLEDHNSFLQLRIPNTVVPESGKFMETKVGPIPKLAIFQITRKDAAVRLFTEGETKDVRESLKIDHLGNRIVVSLDSAAIKALAAKKQAEAIVANTEIRNDIPPPSEALQPTTDAAQSGAGMPAFPYGDKVRIIAIFLGILCAGFGILLLLRPFLRRHIKHLEAEPSISMKTISSMQLAAKQKLSLVQVGNQQLLLGVTPENISFLTSIENQSNRSSAVRSGPLHQRPEAPNEAPAIANKYLEMMRKKPIGDLMDRGTVVQEAQSIAEQPPKKPKKIRIDSKPKTASHETKAPAADAVVRAETEPATQVKLSSKPAPKTAETDSAIADVTQMIREKIKSLPKI